MIKRSRRLKAPISNSLPARPIIRRSRSRIDINPYDDQEEISHNPYLDDDDYEHVNKLFDGKNGMSVQGQPGIWRDILDDDGFRTGNFYFEITHGKSDQEITQQLARINALYASNISDEQELVSKKTSWNQNLKPLTTLSPDFNHPKSKRIKPKPFGKGNRGKVKIQIDQINSQNYRKKKHLELKEKTDVLIEAVREAEVRRSRSISRSVYFKNTEPCKHMYKNGKFYSKGCPIGPKCKYAHTPKQLANGLRSKLCCYDFGKGLCKEPNCNSIHTIATGECTCGMRERSKHGLDTRILCKCSRRRQTAAEQKLKLDKYIINALHAPVQIGPGRRSTGSTSDPSKTLDRKSRPPSRPRRRKSRGGQRAYRRDRPTDRERMRVKRAGRPATRSG